MQVQIIKVNETGGGSKTKDETLGTNNYQNKTGSEDSNTYDTCMI